MMFSAIGPTKFERRKSAMLRASSLWVCTALLYSVNKPGPLAIVWSFCKIMPIAGPMRERSAEQSSWLTTWMISGGCVPLGDGGVVACAVPHTALDVAAAGAARATITAHVAKTFGSIAFILP